ncbi:uncharacterized protein F5147DRAFT_841123 [Suillus discolor]|uniref:WD40 repeat-like protein n=1 Tax=Suillus discolor TaxID=1912936 RepID=A0A9P7EU71_9AGAM|nr:uncharacterized protein F5147DRAFT_841123 [Suillus discolor]KAG2089438.1 hypothetical protein F5147DRAFT_841123 [Suillus discolor]
MTLEGHGPWKHSLRDPEEYKHISCISYFSDGKQMISGSGDKTIRQWDLREGKEIEEAREVSEHGIVAVRISRDGRWVVSASDEELKVSEVQTGIVRTFHTGGITCIDISADSTLLASGSYNGTARIWSLDTGKLVSGPFKFSDDIPGLRELGLSGDSRKLAIVQISDRAHFHCLQVWDVQAQKLVVQKSIPSISESTYPVLWTTKHKTIVTIFQDDLTTIHEFDASTLKTVGAPFQHIYRIISLALSSDCVLLASSSYDNTIKLWTFESRQLLASFDVESPRTLVLSPDSCQLAYSTFRDTKIYICNIPANILATIELAEEPQPNTSRSERPSYSCLLDFDATRRPVRRKSVIVPVMSPIPRPLPTRDPHIHLRFLRKLFSSSFRTDAVRADQPRNPLDFPATSPLPHPLRMTPDKNSRSIPAPPTIQSSAISTSPTLSSRLHRLSTWWPLHTGPVSPTIVDVPLAPGRLRYAAAGAPRDDDSLIRDEDYVSPPPSPNPGQHGRFCFCF